MNTSPAPPLESWREITSTLFPFLKGLRLSTVSGGLRVLAAASKTLHLQGDSGDPPVARVGDVAGYEYVQLVAGQVVAVYRSAANGPASVWTPVASGIAPPVNGVTVGTPITITTGSGRVTCA